MKKGGQHIDLAASDSRRAARAVTRTTIVAAIVVLSQADRAGPEFLASVGIKRETDFTVHPVDVPSHHRERLAIANGEGTEAVGERGFPDSPRPAGGPLLQESTLRRSAIVVGTAVFRPVSGCGQQWPRQQQGQGREEKAS